MRGLYKATQGVQKGQSHKDYAKLRSLAHRLGRLDVAPAINLDLSAKKTDKQASAVVKALTTDNPELWPDIIAIYPGMHPDIIHWEVLEKGFNVHSSSVSCDYYCTDLPSSGFVLYSRRGDGVWEQRTKPIFPPIRMPNAKPKYRDAMWRWVEEGEEK